jgi:hypothetical protein
MATTKKMVQRILDHGETDREPNARDNTVHRYFWSADRHVIDHASDFEKMGWEQFDTDQDDWYFGVWVNRKLLFTLSYSEGDWILVSSDSNAGYNREIQALIHYHDEGVIMRSLDADGKLTTYRQQRDRFLIS